MISLEDYIIQYDAINGIDFMEESPINEGKILNGIKKFWRWIKHNFKKKDNNVEYFSDDDECVIKSLSYDDIYNTLKNTDDKIKNDIKKNKNHIKVITANIRKKIIGLFVYTENEHSKYNELTEFKNFYYIYTIETIDKSNFYYVFEQFLDYIYENDNNFEGFTIDKGTYNVNKNLFDKLNFQKSDKNVIYCYYEDIKDNFKKINK